MALSCSELLTKSSNLQENARIMEFVDNNIDRFKTTLDDPFSIEELERSLKSLKNNKACCFDQISNEILECSGRIYKHAFLGYHYTQHHGKGIFFIQFTNPMKRMTPIIFGAFPLLAVLVNCISNY